MASRDENQSEAPRPDDTGPDDTGRDGRHRRSIDWRHVARSRLRTSTLILLALFIVCCVLYGYTSQRYGVVYSPARQPPPPRTTSETVEPTYQELPSSTFFSTPSETTTTNPQTGEQGTESPGVDETAPTQTSTPRRTIPGLPNVEIPDLGPQQQTTEVPTR